MTPVLANIFGFGNPWDIAIIAGVVVLLFGGTKLAGFGKSLGEGMKEFKKAANEIHDDPTASDASVQPAPATQPLMQASAAPAEPVAAAAGAPAAEKIEKEQ